MAVRHLDLAAPIQAALPTLANIEQALTVATPKVLNMCCPFS